MCPIAGPMYAKVTYDKNSPSCDFLFCFAVIFAITWFYDFCLWCDIFICYDFEFISRYIEKNFLPGTYHVLNYLMHSFNAIRPHIFKLSNI